MVTDVNEAPAFADEPPTPMVAENTAAGANIGAPVVATDVDSDDTLTYTLGGTDAVRLTLRARRPGPVANQGSTGL